MYLQTRLLPDKFRRWYVCIFWPYFFYFTFTSIKQWLLLSQIWGIARYNYTCMLTYHRITNWLNKRGLLLFWVCFVVVVVVVVFCCCCFFWGDGYVLMHNIEQLNSLPTIDMFSCLGAKYIVFDSRLWLGFLYLIFAYFLFGCKNIIGNNV